MRLIHRSHAFLSHCRRLEARHTSSSPAASSDPDPTGITHLGRTYQRDAQTNATPRILSFLGRDLHLQRDHPLSLVRQRIASYFNKFYRNARHNPRFTIVDNLSPIVSIEQNFDSLLIPADHVSRRPNDTYYINSDYLLRSHTSAHEADLMRSGLDEFLVFGDCYRRDEIDATHYPVFHQVEGVSLRFAHQLPAAAAASESVADGVRTAVKQETHSAAAAAAMERDMKICLEGLMRHLFGSSCRELRWVQEGVYFPFTHPSWELEMLLERPAGSFAKRRWLELLGCGILEQQLVDGAGASGRIGWAFGVGLERLAMQLFSIPDIRLFWSQDSGFLSQFEGASEDDDGRRAIRYKAVSVYPQAMSDMAFWLPDAIALSFEPNEFYDVVRSIALDICEQVRRIDVYRHPKTGRVSHCYRIVYRHMERTLTREEVNEVHRQIGERMVERFGVEIR